MSKKPHPSKRLAQRAWDRHVAGLGWAPSGWFDLAEEFVGAIRTRNPERTCALLLLALDNAHDMDAFLQGGWICLISAHVYVHAEGPSMGGAAAVNVAERFVRWLGRKGDLDPWDEAHLLHELDVARSCMGAKPRGHASARDCRLPFDDVGERVTARFLAAGSVEGMRPAAVESVVRLVAHLAVAPGTRLVRFGALDPHELYATLHACAAEDPAEDDDGFHLVVLRVAAALYRWLGAEERVEPARAEDIANELTRLMGAETRCAGLPS